MKIIKYQISKIHHIAYIMPVLSTLSFMALYLVSTSSVSAITYSSSVDINFTFNPTINLTLSSSDLIIGNLAPGSYADSNIVTVGVSTNAGYGYYLSATTDSNTLTNTTDNSYVFNNLSTTAGTASTLANIAPGYWGYSYSTDNGSTWKSGSSGNTATGYAGLPLDNNDSGSTGVKLLSTDSYASSGSVKFKIGAKATSTQVVGTYTGTVNFYAVTNPNPTLYMQDVNTTTLASLMPNVGDTTLLIDKRDEQAYRVAKLADNKYWMVENLNIAGGTALSATDTDVSSDYIANFTTSNNLTKTSNTIILPESSPSGFNQNNYSYVYNSNNKTNNCASPGCYSYYSWDTATLGSGRSISTDNTDAPYSVCPKGWHLPNTRTGTDSSSDFRALMIALGGSASNADYNSSTTPTGASLSTSLRARPNNFVFAGVYYEDLFRYGDSSSGYWSSTSCTNTTARRLYFSSNDINSAYERNRYYGTSVRCIAQ